tara:strand:- start:257 stop:559 length:303 start_codon:yes stop_codon:yes gene_type:complete
MKALIFNNKVVDVKETPFEVSESMTWVNCPDDTKIGAAYSDGTFTAKTYPALSYDQRRKRDFPNIGDVIDAIFKKEAGDSTEFDNLATQRQTVKNANPKP